MPGIVSAYRVLRNTILAMLVNFAHDFHKMLGARPVPKSPGPRVFYYSLMLAADKKTQFKRRFYPLRILPDVLSTETKRRNRRSDFLFRCKGNGCGSAERGDLGEPLEKRAPVHFRKSIPKSPMIKS
jgi:hypothetical protein